VTNYRASYRHSEGDEGEFVTIRWHQDCERHYFEETLSAIPLVTDDIILDDEISSPVLWALNSNGLCAVDHRFLQYFSTHARPGMPLGPGRRWETTARAHPVHILVHH
jgi:hypothetical protein